MKNTKKSSKLSYYLSLPYTIKIIPEAAGGYSAEVDELEGCMSQGETWEEIRENLEDAKKLWLEVALEKGLEIPLPDSMREYSGRFLVRLPKYLHRRLASQAKKEGVSLNQLIVSLLSEKITTKEIIQEIQFAIRAKISTVTIEEWREERTVNKDYDLPKIPSFFAKEIKKYYDVSLAKKEKISKQFKQNLYSKVV